MKTIEELKDDLTAAYATEQHAYDLFIDAHAATINATRDYKDAQKNTNKELMDRASSAFDALRDAQKAYAQRLVA
jgi:hypothetical protein